jgi:hypothetical protein
MPYFIPVIPKMLYYYSDNVLLPLRSILSVSPEFYINTVNLLLEKEYSLDMNMFRELFRVLYQNKKCPIRHLVRFCRINKDSFKNIADYNIISYFLSNITSYEDAEFIISNSENKINIKEIIEYYSSNPMSYGIGYLLLILFNQNKKYKEEYLSVFISEILNSQDLMKNSIALIFISNYKLYDIFQNIIQEKGYSFAFKKINTNLSITDKVNFHTLVSTIYRLLHKKQSLENLTNLIGIITHAKVIKKYHYHYLLLIKGLNIQYTSTILPIAECSSEIQLNDLIKVIIIHSDLVNKRLITSMKQIEKNSSELNFRNEYLYLLKIGDIIQCKAVNVNNKIILSPVGLGKHIKVIVINKNFMEINQKYTYEAKVVQAMSPNLYKVKLMN